MHMGKHQKQLALFALPLALWDPDDDDHGEGSDLYSNSFMLSELSTSEDEVGGDLPEDATGMQPELDQTED
jgi:hypothetical protein